MNTENGDIRAVNGAAHVEAAGQRYSDGSWQAHRTEFIVNTIHDRLDDTGCVNGGCVAVSPTLGMDDVGYAGACATDRELVGTRRELTALEVIDQRLNFSL